MSRHRTAFNTAVAGLLLAASSAVLAQSPLTVYSDDFTSGSTAPPATATTGAVVVVDIAALPQLEADTTALAARMTAHLADAGAHQPHSHPHEPHGTLGAPAQYTDAHDHSSFEELLAHTIELLAPTAHAQQPPALNVYNDDRGGPTRPAPSSPQNQLSPVINNQVGLIDTVRNLIADLDQRVTAHIAARPGHAHDHPHTH